LPSLGYAPPPPATRTTPGWRGCWASCTQAARFREIWNTDPTRPPGHRTKTVDHPVAGPLRVTCDVLLVPEDDQQVVLITANPGSPDERALQSLAAHTPAA
jgi:hypothetical protein